MNLAGQIALCPWKINFLVSHVLYFFLQAALRVVTVTMTKRTAPHHTTRVGGWDHLWVGPVEGLVTEALSTVTALLPNMPLRLTLL